MSCYVYLPRLDEIVNSTQTHTRAHTYLQAYLAEFNEFWEELKAKNVGVFGICAEPQNLVDRTMTEWNLHYKVREGLSLE